MSQSTAHVYKKTKLGLLLLMSTLVPVSSFAEATLDDVVNSINNVYNLVASNFTTMMDTASKLIYEDDPNLPSTVTGNSTQDSATSNVNTTTKNYTLPVIDQDLTQKNANPEVYLGVTALGTDSYVETSPIASLDGSQSTTNLTSENANYYAGSLLSPIVYDSDGLTRAQNFVQFVSYLGTPVTSISWSKLSAGQQKTMKESPNGQKYKATVRSIAAARSIALDNLYNILSERVSVPDLGTQTGIPDTKDASPMQVDEYLATRRTKDQDWYNDMAKASPATVSREQLFVLAEMQRQLYELHKDNERIITTLSLIELQNSNLSKNDLVALEQKVKTELGISTGTLPSIPSVPLPPMPTGTSSSTSSSSTSGN